MPREHVIDPWSPFLGYVLEAQAHGATVLRSTEVLGGSFDGRDWRLDTTDAPVAAGTVINCAGLFGDVIEQRLLGESHFTIKPRKGQFVVFDKLAARLLRSIILPVPNERTKGVVLARTVFGNVLVGPTAEEQEDRDRPTVTEPELRALIARATEMVPALADVAVTATYAGLRPASEEKHYRVRHEPDRNFVTVGGIRSTGMTAALGLARHVERLVTGDSEVLTPLAPAVPLPTLAEHTVRDWQRAGHGEVVCHCEMVTRREIETALSGSLPPRDLGGLRRRTRCAMGRCQGFNCLGTLAEITADRFHEPIAMGPGP